MHSLLMEVPPLEIDALPEEERPFGSVVWFQLPNLATSVSSFGDALALFEMCLHEGGVLEAAYAAALNGLRGMERIDKRIELKPAWEQIFQYSRWKLLAARDGSMSLWHFMRALQSLKHSLDKAKTLRGTVKIGEIDNALKTLHNAYPDIKDVRDSVGHTSELMGTPRAIKENSTKPFTSGTFTSHATGKGLFANNLDGRVFTTTAFGGDTVKYELSTATLQSLVDITRIVYGAFATDGKHKAG